LVGWKIWGVKIKDGRQQCDESLICCPNYLASVTASLVILGRVADHQFRKG